MVEEKEPFAVKYKDRSIPGKAMSRDWLEAVVPSDDNIHTGGASEALLDGFGLHGVETVEQYPILTGGEQRDASVQLHKGPRLLAGRYKFTPLEVKRVVDADGTDRRYLLTDTVIHGTAQIGDLIDESDVGLGTTADFASVTRQTGSTPTNWDDLFDFRRDTFIKADAAAAFTIRFRGTRLISRIVFETRAASRMTIDILDIRGNVHRVLNGSLVGDDQGETPCPDAAGVDTGNFGPLEAKAIYVTCHQAAQIYRANIRRALEVKIANAVREEDDITFDDLDHGQCNFTQFLTTNDNNAMRYLFDWNPAVGVVSEFGAGIAPVIDIHFNKPQLVARVAILAQTGQSIRNTSIERYGVDGALIDTPLDHSAIAAAVTGEDTGNVDVQLCRSVRIVFTAPAAAVYPAVVMIKRAKESKITVGGGGVPISPRWSMASVEDQALVAGDNDVDLNWVNSGANDVQYGLLRTTHIRLDDQARTINSLTVYRDAARTETIKVFQPGAAGDFHLDSQTLIETDTDGTLYVTINVDAGVNADIELKAEEFS